jgi:hypothetical protein
MTARQVRRRWLARSLSGSWPSGRRPILDSSTGSTDFRADCDQGRLRRPCRLQLTLDHRLDELTHPITQPASIASNQSSRRWTVISASDGAGDVVPLLGHGAVSTGVTTPALVGFQHLETTPSYSNHTPDGTQQSGEPGRARTVSRAGFLS